MTTATVWWARRQDARPELAALLDATEHERWTSYRQAADRERFLVGCTLAKAVVAVSSAAAPAAASAAPAAASAAAAPAASAGGAAEVTLDRTCPRCGSPHGKPKVKGGDLELSVSHSGDRIVVAAARATPLGVDVEDAAGRPRGGDDPEALERYVLSGAELAAFVAQAAADRRRDFLVVWTRKEAVLKATGDGLNVALRDLVITAPAAPPEVLAWPYEQEPGTVTLRDLDAGPGYVAALAVLGRCDEIISRDGTALLATAISR